MRFEMRFEMRIEGVYTLECSRPMQCGRQTGSGGFETAAAGVLRASHSHKNANFGQDMRGGSVVQAFLDTIAGRGDFLHDHLCRMLHFGSRFNCLIQYSVKCLLGLLPFLLDFITFVTKFRAGQVRLHLHFVSLGL
jgi:hypothetical protein